jgi:hypothetical protein
MIFIRRKTLRENKMGQDKTPERNLQYLGEKMDLWDEAMQDITMNE